MRTANYKFLFFPFAIYAANFASYAQHDVVGTIKASSENLRPQEITHEISGKFSNGDTYSFAIDSSSNEIGPKTNIRRIILNEKEFNVNSDRYIGLRKEISNLYNIHFETIYCTPSDSKECKFITFSIRGNTRDIERYGDDDIFCKIVVESKEASLEIRCEPD